MNRNRPGIQIALLLCAACTMNASSAHHSVSGFFDPRELVEIEGVVTATLWRNPHTEFHVEVTDSSGEVLEWRVETGALSVLRALGLDREFLHTGDHIRVIGDRSLRGLPEIFARNLVLPNGTEVLLTTRSKRYFTLTEAGDLLKSDFDETVEETARRNADGIFRVWSTDLNEVPHSGVTMLDGDYPLSADAEATRSQWDAGDVTLLGCTVWNMPRLMGNPLPMEFVRQDNNIVIRFEEDDNERLIHMTTAPEIGSDTHTLLGHSIGHWEGESLVIETTNIEPDVIDTHGTPSSSAMELVERFTPSAAGDRLDYRVTITDPETYTQPFVVERHWIWRPEIAVRPYACGQDQELR